MNMADSIQKMQNSQHLEFSVISGYNCYCLPEDLQVGEPSHAIHMHSSVMVHLVPLRVTDKKMTSEEIQWHKQLILQPMTSRSFDWPIDVIECKTMDGKYAVYNVFAQRTYLDYVPLKKLLYQRIDSKHLDWRNQNICRVARSFLKALQKLDDAGYNYNCFDINRILYKESTGDVVLRYTTQIRFRDGSGELDQVIPEDIATEFAPPSIYLEDFDGIMPRQANYYTAAAILFRLMVGRLPYEGRGLSNYGQIFDPVRDVDALNHKNYFLNYHKFPHFIFDEKDDANRIAPMQENDLVRDRWHYLHDEMKKMFQDSLCEATALRLPADKLYSPAQWLEACNRYCWNAPEFGGE